MLIFINCSNLRFGGAKTVGMNIIRYFLEYTPHRIVIAAPYNSGYEQFETERSEVITIPGKYNSPLYKAKLNNNVLPALEHRFKPDIVLSLGNIAFRTQAPQLLLIHQAFLVYPRSEVWKRISLRQWLYLKTMVFLIRKNLKYATYIRLQTQTMCDRFRSLFPQYKEVDILPNSIATTSLRTIAPLVFSPAQGKIPLLLLSKLFPHKNFDILFEVARLIRAQALPFTFTLTIERSENKESAVFLDQVEREGLGSILINAGHIAFDAIPDLYERHYGLFLPTLLESFSGTYIEAMHFGRPIFTSDMDFAREVCRDSAYYFVPTDATHIVQVLKDAFDNTGLMQKKINEGRQILEGFKSWKEIGDELNLFLENPEAK